VSGIRPGDSVTLHYRLSCAGQEIVSTFAGEPETFRLGDGAIDPRLEWLLHGLEAGAHETWRLDPEQAFGRRDEGLVKTLARTEFPAGMEPVVGHEAAFPMPNGQIFMATILAVDANAVKLDFNHPLAGLSVEFEVRILAVESA
jgi:FKBP-type peptidyl-prolyl cis-trans isomerase SlpA